MVDEPSRPIVDVHGGSGVERLRRQRVFVELFEAHWARVRRHIECVVENDDEVDELVADVFRVGWEKLKPDSPMGLPWLLRTADNKLRDRERRSRSRDRALVALTRRASVRASEFDALDRLEVRDALSKLSARERRVVMMTYWDELSAGEIAEVMGCSQGSVWTLLSRARAKLRSHLSLPRGGGGGE
jgi:RNA polymerase sigma factor (sigma-70 family)